MESSVNKQTLRIAVDIRTLSDAASGIQNALIALLNQLQSLDTANEYLLFETRNSSFQVHNPGWKRILLPTYGLPGVLWEQTFLPRFLSTSAVDVLWAPKSICPLWLDRRIRVFTTIHDLTYVHYPATMTVKDRMLCRMLIPLSARRSTAIFTVSNCIKRDIEDSYPSLTIPVIAIPHGRPAWSVPSDYSCRQRQEFLFFAGNLEPRKNLLNAVKALEALHAQGTSIELQIASPSSWKSGEIMDYISKSPVKNKIQFLGFLSLDELKRKYLSCKALLYPSLYEGFGLPVLEALAMDCPVLTSQNTSMQEIAEESAVYFNPLDPADIADKIRFVCSSSFDRNVFLKNRNRILDKYSWERAARTICGNFESHGRRVLHGLQQD